MDQTQQQNQQNNENTEGAAVTIVSRFPMGRIVCTPGALEVFDENIPGLIRLLERHGACDWGDLEEEDKAANNRALTAEERIFSAYHAKDSEGRRVKIWVITEWDRSATTILLPSEY